jgi:type I restriction enzyme S subunit
MSDKLPRGWAVCALKDVATWSSGGTPARATVRFFGKGIPWVKSGDLKDGPILTTEEQITEAGLEHSAAKLLPVGTVCMALYGATIGKLGIMTFPAATNQACANAIPTTDLVRERYLFFYLLSQRESFINLGQGGAQPNISQTIVREYPIRVAPSAEQRRIVAKLEKLLGKVEACQKRLAKIPIILKRFRQSVLDAAVTGKITVDWRSGHEFSHNAHEELEALLAKSERDREDVREAEPTEGHETVESELPSEWATSSLGSLFRFIDYRGKTPKKSESGKRLISAKNIRMGYVSDEPVEYVSNEFYRKWMTRGFPRVGDIFFVTEGHTMGFVALNNRMDDFALSQRTITLQPWVELNTETFFYFLMSPLFQNLVRINATGSAAVGIKAAKFRGLPIPFPTINEQQEIVRRAKELFKLADQLEVRYAKAKAHVDKLTQSILAKAFRGELVPQDSNDEPASALLDRIKRETQSTVRSRKKQSSRAQILR